MRYYWLPWETLHPVSAKRLKVLALMDAVTKSVLFRINIIFDIVVFAVLAIELSKRCQSIGTELEIMTNLVAVSNVRRQSNINPSLEMNQSIIKDASFFKAWSLRRACINLRHAILSYDSLYSVTLFLWYGFYISLSLFEINTVMLIVKSMNEHSHDHSTHHHQGDTHVQMAQLAGAVGRAVAIGLLHDLAMRYTAKIYVRTGEWRSLIHKLSAVIPENNRITLTEVAKLNQLAEGRDLCLTCWRFFKINPRVVLAANNVLINYLVITLQLH